MKVFKDLGHLHARAEMEIRLGKEKRTTAEERIKKELLSVSQKDLIEIKRWAKNTGAKWVYVAAEMEDIKRNPKTQTDGEDSAD